MLSDVRRLSGFWVSVKGEGKEKDVRDGLGAGVRWFVGYVVRERCVSV